METNWDIDSIMDEASGGPSDRWHPVKETSDNMIRIVPGKPLYVCRFIHWNILDRKVAKLPNGKDVIDPAFELSMALSNYAKTLKKNDPVYTQLMGFPGGIASGLRQRSEVFYDVVVRGEEEAGVRWVQFPYASMYKDLFQKKIKTQLRMAEKRGYKWNLFDPEEGYDLSVGYHPDTAESPKDIWTVEIDSMKSPIGVDGWQDQLHDLEAIASRGVVEMTPLEMARLLADKHDTLLGQLQIPGAGSVRELVPEVFEG